MLIAFSSRLMFVAATQSDMPPLVIYLARLSFFFRSFFVFFLPLPVSCSAAGDRMTPPRFVSFAGRIYYYFFMVIEDDGQSQLGSYGVGRGK